MNYAIACLFTLVGYLHGHADADSSGGRKDQHPPADGIRIAWDHSSMQQIADKGSYPRLRRLKDSSIIIIYETRTGSIEYKRSYDEGITWSVPVTAFAQFVYATPDSRSTIVNMANPEIIQLHNGDIVIGCNYRPAKPEIAPYTITIRRSTDNGRTWLPPQALYNAAPRFRDGCWEPSFLQLPNGELHVYFANEHPYQHSDEQEISVLRSPDNGVTWSEAQTVSFRKNRRDGMPVAAIAGDDIVVVIEDNHIDQFKPYTVRTKLADNWQRPVLAHSPDREYALNEKIPDTVYMGAPYLLKLPSGGTLISYQTNENRSSDWELSTMEVAVGDKTARKFGRQTQPFAVPLNKEAKWNSLALWDKNTVIALTSSNVRSKSVAPWLIKGYIISDLQLTAKEITDHPVFIGSKGNTSLKAGFGADTDNLYINCRITDSYRFKEASSGTGSDGVYLFLNTGGKTYKIWSDWQGNTKAGKLTAKHWRSELTGKIRVFPSAGDNGYELRFIIPKKALSVSDSREIRCAMALSAYDNDRTGYVEMLVNSDESRPDTWLKIKLTK